MGEATGLRRGATGTDVRALCVFVHGRGQSPEEMEGHVLGRLSLANVAFALPRAPRGAWYDAKAVDPLEETTRAQMDEAFAIVADEITSLRRDYPGLPLLLGGFSQGACLSIEFVCRGEHAPDALLAFTGCRVGTMECDRPRSAPAGLKTYLTGSDNDPWISARAMSEAFLDLNLQGLRMRADVFPGRGHEVSDTEIAMLETILADLGAGRDPGLAAPRQ